MLAEKVVRVILLAAYCVLLLTLCLLLVPAVAVVQMIIVSARPAATGMVCFGAALVTIYVMYSYPPYML